MGSDNEFDEMGFFEALDCAEQYNGNPEPFRRCRALYRERGQQIDMLKEALTVVMRKHGCLCSVCVTAYAALGQPDPRSDE